MGWFIACFRDDQSVSMVSEKWPKKNFKNCYFPKTKIMSKIRKETPVDKKSGQWSLHSCRILMGGKKYATFKEAKEAEKIAQDHSTMSSFENSYAANQEKRKHPKVYRDSTSAESDCEEAKKIEELKKLDDGLPLLADKEYTYHLGDARNNDQSGNQSWKVEEDRNWEKDEVGGLGGEDVVDNSTSEEGSDDEQNDDTDGEEKCDTDDEENSDTDAEENGDNDGNFVVDNDTVNENFDAIEDDDENVQAGDACEKNIFLYPASNLESTSELSNPAGDYDFSDDRRIVRVEKLLLHACQELESIKHEMKALKIKSNETEQVVEKLVLVCKDLSVEVFACTEELKKRNGLFTDILVPDLKLAVKRRKDYKKNELALANNKIVDNMIKYLASTVNERKEKHFIAGCYNVIFDADFLVNKVWWKSEPGKVLIKKSRILHCMKEMSEHRNVNVLEFFFTKMFDNLKDNKNLFDILPESFKLKFGLFEPRKNDKDIVKLIHGVCRNIKDKHRKALKKGRDAEESAKETARETAKEKTAKKGEKKGEKKVEKKGEKETVRESACQNMKETAAEMMDWNIDGYEEYKKHRKARKAAKRSKSIAEQGSAEETGSDVKKQKKLR